jgi:hypothetical protein
MIRVRFDIPHSTQLFDEFGDRRAGLCLAHCSEQSCGYRQILFSLASRIMRRAVAALAHPGVRIGGNTWRLTMLVITPVLRNYRYLLDRLNFF